VTQEATQAHKIDTREGAQIDRGTAKSPVDKADLVKALSSLA
jgi:hypothetical protein